MTTKPRASGSVGLVALAGALAACLTWLLARAWPDAPVEAATLASVAFVPLWTGLALLLLAWRRGTRPGALRRRYFGLHRRLGGALVLVAMIVFGSGVGAILDRSLARWQLVEQRLDAPPPLHDQPLDAVLAELVRQHPRLLADELALHPASEAQPWIRADFRNAEGELVRVDFDPRSGVELGRGDGPLWVLRELHRRLLAPPLLGETLLGLIALVLGLVLLTGLATRRWSRELLRKPRSAQPLAIRSHQWIGLTTLPAALVWAWTGALLGLTLIIVPIVGGAAYGGDRAALMHDVLAVDRPPLIDAAASLPKLQRSIATSCPLIREQLPDAEVHRVLVRHPGHASGTVRVDLERGGILERASFTLAADRSLRDCRALPSAGVGMKSFMGSIVLHYGEWGTGLVDLAYLLLGSLLVALAWLGGGVLARRREREGDLRGAERLRRSLLGVGLGLPLASASLALLSRFGDAWARDQQIALIVFALSWALALAATHTGALAQRRRWLVGALACLLLLVPIVGWIHAGAHPGPVEACLAVLGLALAGQQWWTARGPRHASPRSPEPKPSGQRAIHVSPPG